MLVSTNYITDIFFQLFSQVLASVMIKLLVGLETAEEASRKMEEVDQFVMFQGLIRVQIRLKEQMVGILGTPAMVEP